MEPFCPTPKQVADGLYALMPHTLSHELLQEYGIEANHGQRLHITREILSLNLFWVHSALEALVTSQTRDGILRELYEIIRSGWEQDFNLDPTERDHYFNEFENRRLAYERITSEGGEPVSVFSETTALLESDGVVRPEDHGNMLALLVDLIPVESFGELAEEIEPRDS